MVAAVVGAVFVSGNTLRPDTDTVVAIVAWADLNADERRQIETIQHFWSEERRASESYVRYSRQGCRGVRMSPREVFEATRYHTWDDMFAAYRARA